ncbi:Uncharacterized protein TCM_017703 [Theobroma cacao]|uniref:Uncharacterized protein n=1 Tax=Theobroma cacao TaxID=3641 RepID=A0A061EFL2_THECC|nr:Uncharacterized protein TCM_017703 [Theobroma cacao]
MLVLQKAFFNKEGLGYDFTQKETHFKNFFVKANEKYDGVSRCTLFLMFGHSTLSCSYRIVTERNKVGRYV